MVYLYSDLRYGLWCFEDFIFVLLETLKLPPFQKKPSYIFYVSCFKNFI